MLRFWIAAIGILALHAAAAADQSARDNRANQLNPNNDAYWNSRGMDRPSSDYEDDERAARDSRTNRLNPNNDAYRQRLMRDIVRDIEAALSARNAVRRAAWNDLVAAIRAARRDYDASPKTGRDRRARDEAISAARRDYGTALGMWR